MLTRLDRLPFLLWAALSILGYLGLALLFPLLPTYNHVPLSDVRSMAPALLGGLGYGLLICLLFAFMVMAYRQISLKQSKPNLTMLIGITFLFALPLLLVYPINANDIYRYVIRGRISSTYGENPFEMAPDSFAGDPYLPLAGEWAEATSPYGPLWELTASGITHISGDGLLVGLLLFKLLGLLAFAGSAVLIWLLFSSGQQSGSLRSARTLLWAWNPALLLIFVANGHNDALMIFCLLLGYLVVKRGHEEIGFLLMLLGPLVKPIAVLALPFFFISILMGRPSLSSRLRFLAISIVGGLILVLLAFLPFGYPWELGRRLVEEAAGGAGFSIAAAFILAGQALGIQISIPTVAQISSILFILFVLWLLWKSWRGREPLRGAADIFFGYILQALNFRIWYAAWPFPWLLLDTGKGENKERAAFRLRYGLWFLLTTQLSVILYGHIRIHLLDGSQLWAHILGILLLYGLPLVLSSINGSRVK